MKVTPKESTASTVTFKTTGKSNEKNAYKWWLAKNDKDRSAQMISTAAYLKEGQNYRLREAAIFARLYGNKSLFNFMGSNSAKLDTVGNGNLPNDRPTFNLVSSVIDTKIAKISQSRPAPIFLTDDSDYKERRLAKQLNNFILGEFYQTKAYDKVAMMLRDALVLGTGCMKIFETDDHKVGLERVLPTEILIDANEAMYGDPRQIYQIKLVDRSVLLASNPKFKTAISDAEAAYPDNSSDSSKSVSDLVMVVEGWHLPSGKNATDGRHTIACSSGIIFDEAYTKDKFPFVFLHDSSRLAGFWSQGTAERLMGTQMEINKLLFTISRSMQLIGVTSVWIHDGSKISKSSFSNGIGTINSYQGEPPIFMTPTVVPQELYAQLQRLIEYGYQVEGTSQMQAGSQKPAGLNSGEAQRVYDDISTDRMSLLSRHYDNVFVDLAYAMTDKAMEICEEQGEYQTIFPDKRGTKQIDLPKMDLLKNPFVIQCFNMSSLPKDPAGRMQKVTEMAQSGMISLKEARRLLDYPDLEQVEKLANASEERIFQILDAIVEDGEFTPPDPFLDLDLATELTVQYVNLYTSAKLEEEKAQMLRDFFTAVQDLKAAAQPPAPPAGPGAPGAAPMAAAAPQAVSPLVPNGSIG